MIFPYPPDIRRWLDSKGRCEYCRQRYSADPCERSDHYRTCLDLAYEYLDEQRTTDELNQPEEEIAYL